MRKVRSFIFLFSAGIILLFSNLLFAQSSQGTIQGTVSDQTGGALARASVTVIDVARGVTRTLTADAAGAYVAPNLTPGSYMQTRQAIWHSPRARFPGIWQAQFSPHLSA